MAMKTGKAVVLGLSIMLLAGCHSSPRIRLQNNSGAEIELQYPRYGKVQRVVIAPRKSDWIVLGYARFPTLRISVSGCLYSYEMPAFAGLVADQYDWPLRASLEPDLEVRISASAQAIAASTPMRSGLALRPVSRVCA